MPITVAGVDSDDTVFVTIKGLTRYEAITDNLDHKVFTGSSITLTADTVKVPPFSPNRFIYSALDASHPNATRPPRSSRP